MKERTLHRKNGRQKYASVKTRSDRFEGFISINTDIIAFYYIDEGEKIYILIDDYEPIAKNLFEMEDLKRRARVYLKSTYSYIKQRHDLNEIEVNISLIIDKQGNIEKVEYLGTYPDVIMSHEREKFEQDVIQIASKVPPYKPAKIGGHFVYYRGFLRLKF